MAQKTTLNKTLATNQSFTYTKGEVQLNFTLSQDKSRVNDFLEILKEAAKDVEKMRVSL